MNDLILQPIGYVRNNIANRSDMTPYGVKSTIEILREYDAALDGIEENSHLIVSCFFHKAKRDILRVHPRKFSVYSMTEKGVFATRSPDRPNPISFTIVRLLGITKKNTLEVEGLDLIDGTPVIDIKPYTDMDIVSKACRLHSPDKLFENTPEEALYEFIKKGLLNYIHEKDSFFDRALECFVSIVKRLGNIPDRNLVKSIHTNFTGNALDGIYFLSKFTPGEDKIFVEKPQEKENNTMIKIYLKSGAIIKSVFTSGKWQTIQTTV